MENNKYSVYVKNRPIKILHIIKQDTSPSLINSLLKFNYDKWGGRYNPIIICDGNTIDDATLKFISEYDPDIINSLIPISSALINKLNDISSPFLVEVPSQRDLDNEDDRINLNENILSIHPTPRVLRMLNHGYYEKISFVTFDIGACEDETIKLFIKRNFGDYPFSYWSRELFDKIHVKTYNITDKESLLNAITELCDYSSVIFPSQLCSLSSNILDIEYHRMADVFSVIIGDDCKDICLFWNNILNTRQHTWPRFNQLWIPTELSNDTPFQNTLKNFLNVKVTGERKEIQFISGSIQQDELENIAENFTKDVWLTKFVHFHENPLYPTFSQSYVHYHAYSNWDMYTISDKNDTIIINPPPFEEHGIMHQEWMVDVLIKFNEGRFRYISGSSYWWQIPKNNYLASYIFKSQARICQNGFPSVSISRNNLKVNINIPDNRALFHLLITIKTPTENQRDPRYSIKPETFDYFRLSDKGKYLSGLLDLFYEIYGASQIIEKRYWRRVFSILSAKGENLEKSRTQIIKNKINKKMNGQPPDFLTSDEGIDWLSSMVFQISKEINEHGKELPFDFFLKEAKKELTDFNRKNSSREDFEFDEDNLKDTIQDLIDDDILLLGVSSHCPFCGYSNWYYIDDAKQTLICQGCNKQFKIQTEPVWHYRLNNLVRIAYANHGLAPVVIVLSQLLLESRSSFFFYPNIELYNERRRKPVGEIDILCIQDGKLIIGEIKQSIKLFNTTDFNKMKDLAIKLLPDKIIFSSFDKRPSSFIKTNIERIKNELSNFKIEVMWYQIHSHVFDATPPF